MPIAALLDVDGTLVDTNYHHAIAWFRSFREGGLIVPVWRCHRHIGIGGDQFVAAVAGDDVEERLGDRLRDGHARHYHAMRDDVELMPDAQRLVECLHERGAEIVLASSASEEDLEHFRTMLDRDELVSAATSSDDVEQSKPEPDIILAAMEKVSDASQAVLVGDSTWDCRAAGRAGIESVALLTGGFAESELREAGASAVFESIADLLDALEETPLGGGY